ncbi:hypothetical protein TSAR_010917 [Trichomalopsis sarcophagae]|uniref:Uncharacterized protein n=1 Tax=Trichomalopsis sarcophagae TaxID=543379 RepID=A0A232ELA4_9HYME|nr:hypothetical protein TSAR_010917 [Trichomalopsis sarcophagae]
MDRWKGKVAVVTRAGSSLAHHIIKELIKYGMIVVGLSFRYKSMDDIKAFLDIENAPGTFYPRVCNIKYKEDIEETLNWVKSQFGSLNVLINNTGYLSTDDITELEYNDYIETKDISIYGVSNCAIHAAKLMKDNPKHESHILNVNSDTNLRALKQTKKFSDFVYEMSSNLVRDFVETQDVFLSSKTPITLRVFKINHKMSRLASHIIILAVVCLALAQVKADELKNYTSKTKNFPNRKIFVHSNGMNRTNLAYVVCRYPENINKTTCQIKRLSNNQQIPEKSCNVPIKYQNLAYRIFMHAAVTSLNENKALLLWSGTNKKMTKSFTKYSIVDFDSCRFSDQQTTFDQELMSISVLVHDDHYDLIISDSKICGGKLCKLSFDFMGNRISAPSPCGSNVFKGKVQFPPKIQSAPDGIIMARYNLERNQAQVSLVQSNDEKVLKKYDIENLLPFGWVPTFSTDHNTIRMCTWLATDVTCHWFDLNGKPISKHKVDIGYYIISLAVHNLSKGGYILMIAGCSDVDHMFKCREGEDYYDLMKFDADGNAVGSLEIFELKCLGMNQKLDVQLFENKAKESCISFTCLSESKSPNIAKLNFTSKCFSDSEFVE